MRGGIRLCAGVVLVAACAVDPDGHAGARRPRRQLSARRAVRAGRARDRRAGGAPRRDQLRHHPLRDRHRPRLRPAARRSPRGRRARHAGRHHGRRLPPALRRAGGDALAREVAAALTRGILGRDEAGASIIVAAQPVATVRTGGMAADYAGATWQAASASNFQVASRTAIDHIVIHDTEGSFTGTVGWFQDPAAQVSAHYVVKSSDGEIVQMVAEKNIAWHDKCFNATTIGIEHEGYEAHPDVWYTEAMYMQSAKLTAYLADKYGIAKEHGPILGHGEAPDCSDHTDPGPGWNWPHYIDLVRTGGAPHFDALDPMVDAPLAMTSGDVATVTVALTNTGNAAWDLDLTRLGTAAPADRDSAFFVAGAWPRRAGRPPSPRSSRPAPPARSLSRSWRRS